VLFFEEKQVLLSFSLAQRKEQKKTSAGKLLLYNQHSRLPIIIQVRK